MLGSSWCLLPLLDLRIVQFHSLIKAQLQGKKRTREKKVEFIYCRSNNLKLCSFDYIFFFFSLVASNAILLLPQRNNHRYLSHSSTTGAVSLLFLSISLSFLDCTFVLWTITSLAFITWMNPLSDEENEPQRAKEWSLRRQLWIFEY